MTDAGTHALLKKWADAVALRTVHRGVYSPDSTRTVSWPSLEDCAWSTLDTPVALVKLTHPGVAQPHSLNDPLLSLFDNNPNLQAIVLQLHDSDARAVVEHVKKSCGGANRGMSLYLREWEMQDGSPGIHVSGDVAAGWRKWECKAQQVQRGHWEDTAPFYSLHSQSPWSWHADLEGHTLPTWYKGTGMHPSLFFPLTTTPLFGVEHHRVSIPVDVVDHRHVDDLKELPQWGHAFQSGFISVNWMDKLQDEYGELRADAGLNIFNEDWPAETRAGDSDTRRTMTPPEGGAMYSFAREVLIPHLETHLGWKCLVVNVTTFIVVKAGTVDVEKKQCWHRDINLSYVAGPDQHHVICLFPMFSPTPNDGCARDFVVASHTGLPDPWVVAPMAPLDIGDVWLGNALTVHRGGICPTTNPHRPRVFGFILVGTSRFDYNNTCPVVVPPWAGKAAASPEGSQGPHATCGAVGCEVLLDVSDATTVFCVTCGNVPLCATHAVEGQCGACPEGAWNQGETMTQHSGVAWGRCPAPLQFHMPVDGATFFAVHEHLSPSPLRVGVEGHPSYEECPLRQMHCLLSARMALSLLVPPVHWWFRGV